MSQIINKLIDLMRIRGILNIPYHHMTNEIIEWVKGALVVSLCMWVTGKASRWSLFLPSAVFLYNVTYSLATGNSQFALLHGKHPEPPPLLYSWLKEEIMSPIRYLDKLKQTLIQL